MSSETSPLAELFNISKSYGTKQAVKEISFNVNAGEIVGLLGPNGAGKSTSMKMLTGCIVPTGGKVTVNEYDVAEEPQNAQKFTGYLPENAPLYGEWTVSEFLKFAAHARGLKAVKEAVELAIERSGLQAVRKQLIGTLSKGYRQRTCFAQSIIHDPPLLVLDEATDGLDPNQKTAMQQFIKEMGKKKGILFSTHILSEAEAVCDRVLVLNEGKIVHDGDVASLKNRYSMRSRFILTIRGNKQEEVCQELQNVTGIKNVKIIPSAAGTTSALIKALEAEGAEAEMDKAISLLIAERAVQHRWPIIELKQEKSSLNEAFEFVTKNP